MVENELKQKFISIFGFNKVTFDQPSDSKEQETLFVEIEQVKNSIKDGKEVATVSGTAVVFANAEKLPFGYFAKAIKRASPGLTSRLFFSDLETNTRIYRNIVQRGFSFIYFFNSQYDPEIGSITSVQIEITDQE